MKRKSSIARTIVSYSYDFYMCVKLGGGGGRRKLEANRMDGGGTSPLMSAQDDVESIPLSPGGSSVSRGSADMVQMPKERYFEKGVAEGDRVDFPRRKAGFPRRAIGHATTRKSSFTAGKDRETPGTLLPRRRPQEIRALQTYFEMGSS